MGSRDSKMAEIRNYTMNFSSGRAAHLTCCRKLAFTEVHPQMQLFSGSVKDSARG